MKANNVVIIYISWTQFHIFITAWQVWICWYNFHRDACLRTVCYLFEKTKTNKKQLAPTYHVSNESKDILGGGGENRSNFLFNFLAEQFWSDGRYYWKCDYIADFTTVNTASSNKEKPEISHNPIHYGTLNNTHYLKLDNLNHYNMKQLEYQQKILHFFPRNSYHKFSMCRMKLQN